MSSFKSLLLLVLLKTSSNLGFHVRAQQDDQARSPCPDHFQYVTENDQIKHGLVTIDCPEDNVIHLHIGLSVGNNVQGYNGHLELASTREQTIDDVMHRRPINYILNFPYWINTPPRVTKIVVNGKMVCSGPAISLKTVQVLTTINLQHKLTVNYSKGLRGGEEPVTPENRVDTTNPPNKVPIPAIDFQPVLPKDPRKIYQGNFFNNPSRNQFPDEAKPSGDIDWRTLGMNDESCGVSLVTNQLIAKGESVAKGQFPWLVAIFMVRNLGPEFLCGGNLISRTHVLTAAHCMKISNKVHRFEKVFLRLGSHNIQQWTQMSGSKTVGVSGIAVHPDYRPESSDGDIALVTMSEAVDFTKIIRPICLWSGRYVLDDVVGQLGTVVGWGKDELNNLITPEPKQIRLPIVSQEDCLRSHLVYTSITSKRTFCAGFRNGSGPCNGDSGGGFIMKRNDKWTIRGIVSMSVAKDRNCDFFQYFVFSDVTQFFNWIVAAVNESKNFD